MSYILNIVPKQTAGVEFDNISYGNLNISNPDDTSGLLPVDIPLSFNGTVYYFEVNLIFNAPSGYKFVVDLEYTLIDGTECVRQYIFFDEVLPVAGFTTGFSVGFNS